MLLARLRDHVFDIERPTEAGIKLADADFQFRAQLGQRVEPLKDFAPELLLRGFRQLRRFREGNPRWVICYECIPLRKNKLKSGEKGFLAVFTPRSRIVVSPLQFV